MKHIYLSIYPINNYIFFTFIPHITYLYKYNYILTLIPSLPPYLPNLYYPIPFFTFPYPFSNFPLLILLILLNSSISPPFYFNLTYLPLPYLPIYIYIYACIHTYIHTHTNDQ